MSDQPEALRVAQTTLNAIRERDPCIDGWFKLLRYLGKKKADDEPLTLATIADSNGIDDALWCLDAVAGWEREARLYAVWCARKVQHLMSDPSSVAALNVAERHAHGTATDDELAAASAAALNAASAAAWAAASAAERALALAAARAAAWAAASGPLGAIAFTSRKAAARAAALAAARAAALDAASVAAWDAARSAQEKEFRRVFCGDLK